MPIVDGNYVTPNWQNGTSPAIAADELTDIGNSIEQNQTDIAQNSADIGTQWAAIGGNTTSINTNSVAIASLKAATLIFTSISVPVGYWTASTTYSGFGYSATFACTGVTNAFAAQVYFSPTEAMNGNYAPVATTGTNSVTIYAVAIPAATITIPTVVALAHVA